MKFFFLSILIIFISCNSNRTPKDFAVKIDYFGEHYNSKTGVYTRKYNFKQKSTKIVLSQKQKSKLYNYYNEIDFLSFPTEFECDTMKRRGIIPSFGFTVEVTANGIIKSSGTNNYCDCKIELEEEKKLKIFFSEIIKMIEQDEYINLYPNQIE